jgi:enoyl-CoA hydratase/carnithine racemase
MDPALAAGNQRTLADYQANHFLWAVDGGVATITLNRPERKNPLTFDSYAELTATFRALAEEGDEGIRTVVLTGAGGNFCSGGDVADIIGPLVEMAERGDRDGLLRFTTMTGDLVRSMRACPQPIVAAIDGICAGAGAILAMASDLRLAAPDAKTAFLFTRVGLSGADMGACAILPRVRTRSRNRRRKGHRCEILSFDASRTSAPRIRRSSGTCCVNRWTRPLLLP